MNAFEPPDEAGEKRQPFSRLLVFSVGAVLLWPISWMFGRAIIPPDDVALRFSAIIYVPAIVVWAIYTSLAKVMPRRFQFSLRSLLTSTFLAAAGIWLLTKAERVTWWQFFLLVTSAWAAFGAAVGVILGRAPRWTLYGAAIGLAITIFAIVA